MGPDFGWLDARDAALDALADYVHANGWPDDGDFGPLFRAGSAAVEYAYQHAIKDRRWGSYWHVPHGPLDPVGESVAERIGVQQMTWALSEAQWASLWAEADVMRWGGTRDDAAALLGIPLALHSHRLQDARRICRGLWVAPGEHPAGHYRPARSSRIWRGFESRKEHHRRMNLEAP